MPKKDAKQPQPKRKRQSNDEPQTIDWNNIDRSVRTRNRQLTPEQRYNDCFSIIKSRDAEWKKLSYSALASKARDFWYASTKELRVVINKNSIDGMDDRTSKMPESLRSLATGQFKNNPTVQKWVENFSVKIDRNQLLDNICLMRTLNQKLAEYEKRNGFMQWWYRKSYNRMVQQEAELRDLLVNRHGIMFNDYNRDINSPNIKRSVEKIINQVEAYANPNEELERQYEEFIEKNITGAKKEIEEIQQRQKDRYDAQTKLNKTYKALKSEFYKTVPDREAWKKLPQADKQKGYDKWFEDQEKNAGKDTDIRRKIADFKQAKTNFIEIWTKEQANTIRIQLLEKSLKEGKTVEELNEQATNKNVPEPINEDALLSEQLRIDEVVKDQENAYQEVNELTEPINEVEIEEPENEKSV